MRRQKEIDILLELFLVLTVMRNICLFFSLATVATVIFYSAHIVLALIVVLTILVSSKRKVKMTWNLLASVLVIIMLFVIPMTYGLSIWSVSSFTPLSVLLTVLFLVTTKSIIISEKTINNCCVIFIIQAIFAVVCSVLPGSFEYGALELHIGNPNQTAIILWTSFVFCYLYLAKRLVQKKYTFLLTLIMIALVVMIILTQARSIMLAFIICLIWHFWGKRKNGYKNYPLIVQNILVLAPLYIPVLILVLMNILPNEITIFGKLLFSGREQIWKNIADAFINNPFSHHLDTSPFYSNIMLNNAETLKGWGAHNGFLSIQWNYGILVLIPIVFILLINVKELRKYADANINSCIVYVITLATLFSLSFEESLLMGNICTTTILPLLFIIGRSEQYNADLCCNK